MGVEGTGSRVLRRVSRGSRPEEWTGEGAEPESSGGQHGAVLKAVSAVLSPLGGWKGRGREGGRAGRWRDCVCGGAEG